MVKRSSLKQALTVHFLLVAAIPVLFFGLVCIDLVEEHQLKDIRGRNMLLAKGVAEEVEAFLVEVKSDLHQVEEVLNSKNIILPGGENDFLGVTIRNSQFFESLYLLDKKHKVKHLGVMPQLHASRDDYAQLDFSSHQLFTDAPEFNRPTWSSTFVSMVTGELSVTLGLPVRQGVLLGNIRLVSLSQLLQRYARSGELEFAIIDGNGALVAHSNQALALTRLNLRDHPVVVTAMRGQETSGEHHHGSRSYLESVAQIPQAGWMVWVSLNMDVVLTPINNLRNWLAGFMVLAITLGGIIAVINVRRLMLPLTNLGEGAQQIADGDYDFNFKPSGFAEIDTLASQFSSMSAAISVREESIVTSEKRFRNLVNSIDGIVWEMDYETARFLFVSQQAETILGYPTADWIKQDNYWTKIAHPDDIEPSIAYCRLMAEKHEDHHFEFRLFAADGRTVWVRNLVSVVAEGERPSRLLGVMIDITQQKETEAQLKKYRVQLEDLVKERTSQLEAAQAELVQKERLAVLGRLTATVSHEIRNPLGTIGNSIFLLKEALDDIGFSGWERPLSLAERNVARCDGIISELLDFSRQREIQPELTRLDGWLFELLEELSFPEKVVCSWDLSFGATVMIDPERLRRAMVNVVTNALQALDELTDSTPTLKICTRLRNERCEIEVVDNGPGMSAEVMSQIFEPMFSTKNFGVGLGVPIIKNIVEDHGGSVEYQSQPGQGTSVVLWLPLTSPASQS